MLAADRGEFASDEEAAAVSAKYVMPRSSRVQAKPVARRRTSAVVHS